MSWLGTWIQTHDLCTDLQCIELLFLIFFLGRFLGQMFLVVGVKDVGTEKWTRDKLKMSVKTSTSSKELCQGCHWCLLLFSESSLLSLSVQSLCVSPCWVWQSGCRSHSIHFAVCCCWSWWWCSSTTSRYLWHYYRTLFHTIEFSSRPDMGSNESNKQGRVNMY